MRQTEFKYTCFYKTKPFFLCFSVAVLAVHVRVAAGVAGDCGGVPPQVDPPDGRHRRPRRRPRLPLLLLRQPAPPALPLHGTHVGCVQGGPTEIDSGNTLI